MEIDENGSHVYVIEGRRVSMCPSEDSHERAVMLIASLGLGTIEREADTTTIIDRLVERGWLEPALIYDEAELEHLGLLEIARRTYVPTKLYRDTGPQPEAGARYDDPGSVVLDF